MGRPPAVIAVRALALPNDTIIVAVHADRRVRVWSLRTQQVVLAIDPAATTSAGGLAAGGSSLLAAAAGVTVPSHRSSTARCRIAVLPPTAGRCVDRSGQGLGDATVESTHLGEYGGCLHPTSAEQCEQTSTGGCVPTRRGSGR